MTGEGIRAYKLAQELGEHWSVIADVIDASPRVTAQFDSASAQQIRADWAAADSDRKSGARQRRARQLELEDAEREREHPDRYAPDPMPATDMWRFGLSSSTLRKWAQRGYLSPVAADGRVKLYSLADVRRVIGETSKRAKAPAAPPTVHNVYQSVRALGEIEDATARTKAAEGLAARQVNPGQLLDAQRAAVVAGVAASTIRVWVHRGHLTPHGHRGRLDLFLASDVLAVAARRRTV